MKYYAHYNKVTGELSKSNCKCLNEEVENIEISKKGFEQFYKAMYKDGKIVTNPNWRELRLEEYKQEYIKRNDILRDKKLDAGVLYSNVLFDSDTDQKINLLATVSMMSDEDTIVWYGKDNQGLLCTKGDLVAIGQLITELHSYCWENNAYIKEQIANAESVAELESIDMSYEIKEGE